MTSPQRKMQKNINHNNHVHENSYPSSDYHLIMLMGYNETKESKLQRRQGQFLLWWWQLLLSIVCIYMSIYNLAWFPIAKAEWYLKFKIDLCVCVGESHSSSADPVIFMKEIEDKERYQFKRSKPSLFWRQMQLTSCKEVFFFPRKIIILWIPIKHIRYHSSFIIKAPAECRV